MQYMNPEGPERLKDEHERHDTNGHYNELRTPDMNEMRNSPDNSTEKPDRLPKANFIETEVEKDLQNNRFSRPICTRFPPEPTGYLHVGHVKAMLASVNIAAKYNGDFVFRFDDTNPEKEKLEFVQAALDDIAWLDIKPKQVLFASDYFNYLYDLAVKLIKNGHAYACELSPEEMKEYRGDYYKLGRPSPYRDRPVEESLDILERMRAGEFAPESVTIRAKIDMSSPNINMRDPVIYRIIDGDHYRLGKSWHIYPGYDFAQGYSDYKEGVTHSLCSLEFVNHRPLYDWFLKAAELEEPPRQIEFAKMRIDGAVLGKRHITKLIRDGVLSGWDDPRVFTVRGMKRRGFTPESIREFCNLAGFSTSESRISVQALEAVVRKHLNIESPRRMVVINPLRLVLENVPKDGIEVEAINIPEKPEEGNRKIMLKRELYISADDFMLDPPKKFFRLSPGKEVRLRGAHVIKCTGVDTDPNTGEIKEIRATCDLETLGRNPSDGRKIKSVIHWVSAQGALDVELRLYDDLVKDNETWEINPDSLSVIGAKAEPSLANAAPGDRFQFERVGYFCVDPDSTPDKLVFNRTVTLKDKWARIQKQ
jgi:glutaminyl-tRNA synthetase